MDDFTRAYIEAALWASTDDDGEPLDRNYSEANLAPETLERIIVDCERFQEQHGVPEYSDPQYSMRRRRGMIFG